jgi:signal transduction histidine kinase/CheY-like chemotaxis protein/integral membrane sensor domain MASE1
LSPARDSREIAMQSRAAGIAFATGLFATLVGRLLTDQQVPQAGPWLAGAALAAAMLLHRGAYRALMAWTGGGGIALALIISERSSRSESAAMTDAAAFALAVTWAVGAAILARSLVAIICIGRPATRIDRSPLAFRIVIVGLGLVNALVAAAISASLERAISQSAGAAFVAMVTLQALAMVALIPLAGWRERATGVDWSATLQSLRALEAAALVTTVVAVLIFLFGLSPGTYGRAPYQTYWMTPLILWAALRFGPEGTALVTTLFMTIGMAATAQGLGPYAVNYPSATAALLALAQYLVVIGSVGMVGAALIAEREWAMAQLTAWRRRFEAAVDASGEALYEYLPATGEMNWSGAAARVLGVGIEEVDRFGAFLLRVDSDDRERVVLHYEGLAAGEELAAIEYRIVRPDGTLGRVQDRGRAIARDRRLPAEVNTPRVIGFVRDMTRERAMQNEQARMETRLYQAERLQAIGQLAGAIAHDFNNILGSILGYGQMLTDKLERERRPETEPLQRYAAAIVAAGERGRSLVDQVFAFSRPQRNDAQTLELAPVIAEVRELLAGSLPDNLTVNLDVQSGPLLVRGHAVRLHQLLMNLATNAVRAMPDGGQLTISASVALVGAATRLSHGTLSPGTYVRLAVKDTGRGMDAATLARVFEPFFTTGKPDSGRESKRSIGLGLTIVHTIIEEQGAWVDIASVPGAGTTFAVYFTFAGETLPAATTASPEHAYDGGGRVVLLIDDEDQLLAMAEELFAELGFEPVGFSDPVEALAALREDPQRFDLIFTDEVMPGLAGTDVAAAARSVAPHLPVVIASGYGGAGFEARALAAGAAMTLKKPYTHGMVAAAIAQALTTPRR